jgi:hypothetical protein
VCAFDCAATAPGASSGGEGRGGAEEERSEEAGERRAGGGREAVSERRGLSFFLLEPGGGVAVDREQQRPHRRRVVVVAGVSRRAPSGSRVILGDDDESLLPLPVGEAAGSGRGEDSKEKIFFSFSRGKSFRKSRVSSPLLERKHFSLSQTPSPTSRLISTATPRVTTFRASTCLPFSPRGKPLVSHSNPALKRGERRGSESGSWLDQILCLTVSSFWPFWPFAPLFRSIATPLSWSPSRPFHSSLPLSLRSRARIIGARERRTHHYPLFAPKKHKTAQ